MTNIMNKVALCLSGQPRFIQDGFLTFKKNLVGFKDMDIFIHSWDNSSPGNNHNLTHLEDVDNIFNFYKPKDYIIEEQKFDIAPSGLSHDEFVHYSMFYSMYIANKLKIDWETKKDFKYDCVIKSRFDLALLEKLNVLDYDLTHINSPDVCGNPKVISDWFNFSSSKNMDIYLDVYKNMQNYKKEGVKMNSGEELLTHHYKKCNLEILKIKKNLCLIRANKTYTPFWISIEELDNFFKLNNI